VISSSAADRFDAILTAAPRLIIGERFHLDTVDWQLLSFSVSSNQGELLVDRIADIDELPVEGASNPALLAPRAFIRLDTSLLLDWIPTGPSRIEEVSGSDPLTACGRDESLWFDFRPWRRIFRIPNAESAIAAALLSAGRTAVLPLEPRGEPADNQHAARQLAATLHGLHRRRVARLKNVVEDLLEGADDEV
jgi:hypothetical protein